MGTDMETSLKYYLLVVTNIAIDNSPGIVSFPFQNGDFPYVSLVESIDGDFSRKPCLITRES